MKSILLFFILLMSQIVFSISLLLMQPVINKNDNHIDSIKNEKSQRESGIVPNRYNIKFHLDRNFTFVGEVEIQAQVTIDNNKIILSCGSNININSLSITNNKAVVGTSSSSYNKKKEKFTFNLNDTLQVGSMVTINISYFGDLSKHIKSSQTFSYWNKDQVLKKITTLHLKLLSVREVTPCISCDRTDGSEANISMMTWRPKVFIHPKYSSKHRSIVKTNQMSAFETYNSSEPTTINYLPYLITDIGQPSIRKWIQKYNYRQWSSTIKLLRGKNYIEIDEINRISIIDHLFNSAKAELIGYDVSLSAAQYLVQERNYLPWKTAFTHFENLNRKLIQSDVKQIWNKYLFSILNVIYYELGFTEGVDDTNEKKILRSDIIKWTCRLSHFDCISRSSEIFNDWKLNGSKSVPVMLQQTIFCSAIKWGSDDDWNFLWTKYLQADVASEKNAIIYALSCTEEPEKINKLLSKAITKNSGIQFEDSQSIFASVYSSGPAGAEKVVNFIQYNYHNMCNYYKNDSQLLWMHSYFHRIRDDIEWYEGINPRIFEWLSSIYPNEDIYLPRKVEPLEYDIRIIPYLDKQKSTFDGSVSVTLNVLNHTSCIVLHAKQLDISKIRVYNFNNSLPVAISKYSYDPCDKLSIYLGMVVSSGSRLVLDIEYTGFINEKMEGLFRGSYEDKDGNTHLFAATQFERFHARRAFPCFDEPALKASFKISIMRPNHYYTLSNMKLQHSVTSTNGTWDHYEKTVLMSTYLVAFVIIDYKYNSSLNDNYRFLSHANLTNDGNHVLELAQKSLHFLEDYTEIRYPLEKLNFVVIPDFHVGGMENWGLITLKDMFPIILDPSFYSMYCESIIAHEVAHMWFGNLVTCDSWEYLWLNEGFATYFQWIIMESIKPEWKWIDKFIVFEMLGALDLDSAIDSKPMNEKQRNYVDDIGNIKASTIIYEKSACIIRMIEHAFGAEVLHHALKYYLKENQWKTVTPSKLWAALDMKILEAGGIPGVNEPVSILMESWTSQSGYPVVHVNRVCGNLSLTQERFLITKRNESSTQLYWIPISIVSKSNPNFSNTSPTLWMGSKKLSTSLSIADDEWFILNVQQTGFYRVNYDVITWKNLFKTLNQDDFGGIPDIHRTQIIDDLFNLARGGYISYDLVLAGSKYLINETSKLPWKAFYKGFHALYEDLKNENTEIYSKEYFKELISFSRDEIISKEPLSEEQLNKMKKKLFYFWSCRKDFNNCMYQERSYEKYL